MSVLWHRLRPSIWGRYCGEASEVVLQDGDGGIVAANQAAEQILGLSFEQMQGRTSADPRCATP